MTRPCALCGGSLEHAHTVNVVARYETLQRSVACPRCALVQASPMPSEQSLSLYYRSGAYRREYPPALRPDLTPGDEGYQASLDPHFIDRRARRMADLHDLRARHDPPLTAYDEGCGAGYAGQALAIAAGIAVFGRDSDPAMEGEAMSRGVVHPRADRAHALAYALHVLEHATDPVAFVQALALKVTPRGVVHVEVPDVERITGPRTYWFQWPHVLNFSARTLQ